MIERAELATINQELLRSHARAIWQAAVDAVRPATLLRRALTDPDSSLVQALRQARRILVVGGGKAGAAMSAAVEELLPDLLPRMEGVVNVPAEMVRALQAIRLVPARPSATNEPTEAGVQGSREILDLLAGAGPEDVALCLISGGGSAMLPAPVEGVSLGDKQAVTRLLHACGATINEMNCVRKHLSLLKGGRLGQAFAGKALFSLILSDVIGDPLDVIASGPTAPDPTTFADALAVLEKFRLEGQTPASILAHLKKGGAGKVPETPKTMLAHIHNLILGNNTIALAAAQKEARILGYRVLNLGSYIEGETRDVAVVHAGIVRSMRRDNQPFAPPACLLSGGETTVTLAKDHGRGGRNQEFVLAALCKLGREGMKGVIVLSGGTDGEDGPTDAAGALADMETLRKSETLGLAPESYLARNDAYTFFEQTGDLFITGLTQTNVCDVRVVLAR